MKPGVTASPEALISSLPLPSTLPIAEMVSPSMAAAEALDAEGVRCTVVNCRFLKPYDRAVFEQVVRAHPAVLTVEEGQITNGFGAFMTREIHELELVTAPRIACMGMPDEFIEHGARDGLLADIGLDTEGIKARVKELVASAPPSTASTSQSTAASRAAVPPQTAVGA